MISKPSIPIETTTCTPNFQDIVNQAKQRLVQMHYESNAGHVGGNLSCIDILMVLFHKILKPEDRFILSKGHSAGALYVTLWSIGQLSNEDLKGFHKDNGLSGHIPISFLDRFGIPATGSLGHGLSLAAGIALAKKLKKESGHIYCLLSDGELQEGSTLEAFNFIAQHELPITVIIDNNGLQGFSETDQISYQCPEILLEPYSFDAVGFNKGHDWQAIEENLKLKPLVSIMHTRKGNGIPDIQDKLFSHYKPLTKEQYDAYRTSQQPN